MFRRNGRYVIRRENNVLEVDFSREPDPPAPNPPALAGYGTRAHHPLHQDGGVDPDVGGALDQVRRRRIGVALMGLGHVLVGRDMARSAANGAHGWQRARDRQRDRRSGR